MLASPPPPPDETRRDFLARAAFLGVPALLGSGCAVTPHVPTPRLRQSVAAWCFVNQGPKWSVETLVRTAAELGCASVELVDPEHWPLLRRHGLVCAATKSHTFVRGMCNPAHWPECHEKLRAAIEVTSAAGFPNVMTFTGMLDTSSEPGGSRVDPEQAMEHCVEGYRRIVGEAERANVTLVLEPLNTRDPAPMRGHPGYFGDHVEECMEIIRRVDSPSLKLLFDVYHVQIMDGDLVRRIRDLGDAIGHVQVAGCPGRGPLGATQEIRYATVMRALADSGYAGYVGHEWIAEVHAREHLAEAVRICSV